MRACVCSDYGESLQDEVFVCLCVCACVCACVRARARVCMCIVDNGESVQDEAAYFEEHGKMPPPKYIEGFGLDMLNGPFE